MNKIENELLLEVKEERELLRQHLVSYIGENLDQVYLNYVKGLQLNKDTATTNLHIVYTPLHGTGQKLVPQALQNYGFQHITIVDEQKMRILTSQPCQLLTWKKHRLFSWQFSMGSKQMRICYLLQIQMLTAIRDCSEK